MCVNLLNHGIRSYIVWMVIQRFCIIKPIRCTNFSNFSLEWNSTCFLQFLCTSLGVFNVHTVMVCHTVLQTACEQDQDGTSWSCPQAVSKPVWHIPLLCVQWKTPDDGQRNCPKHVDFHSKNKFEKSVHLVGFIIQIYHGAWSHKRQILQRCLINFLNYIKSTFEVFPHSPTALIGQGYITVEALRSHSDTPNSVGFPWRVIGQLQGSNFDKMQHS
jgi:hypothetical protein